MACNKKTLLLISAYADGEATPEESAKAIEHLEHCSECRKLVGEWQRERQLFEWTFARELPEEFCIEPSGQSAQEERQMTSIESAPERRGWGRWRWSWARAGLLATVASIAFVIYYFATLPPMFEKSLATGNETRAVRMDGGIRLELGPGSRISRIDNRSIRLEQGQVMASVRHGTGFRVLTNRIEVVDQGTRFDVTTGPKADCVVVKEGSVVVYKGKTTHEVKAGQFLLAQENGEPSVAALNPVKPESEEDYKGVTISHQSSISLPQGGDGFDWNEGLKRLASRFPDVVVVGMNSNEFETGGKAYRIQYSTTAVLRRRLNEHRREIAFALAGGSVGSGYWEIPVAVVQADGITSPVKLPGDAYLASLVCNDGKIVWRLSGARGHDVDFPLAFESPNFVGAGGSSSGQYGSTEWGTDQSNQQFKLWLSDWPGKLKPMLQLGFAGVPVSERAKDQLSMMVEVNRQTSGINGFVPKRGNSNLLYLDTERKHRIMTVFNTDIGKQLLRMRKRASLSSGGSLLIGALITDVPLEEPSSTAGVYLLWWVLPDPSKAPHWEITTPDMERKIVLSSKQSKTTNERSASHTWGASLEGVNNLSISAGYMGEDKNSFLFRFTIDDYIPDRAKPDWGEGFIWVKRP